MKNQIANYIKAGYPGINISSFEEVRVEGEVLAAAKEVEFDMFAWSVTTGIVDMNNGTVQADTQDPIDALKAFAKGAEKRILLMRDLHMFMSVKDANPVLVRQFKDTLLMAKASNKAIVTCGCVIRLPIELQKEICVIEFSLPDKARLAETYAGIAESAGMKNKVAPDAVLDAASGLTTMEAENAFALSLVEAEEITPAIVNREKAQTVKKNGLLEIIPTKVGMDDVGGLATLKAWVAKRKEAFTPAAAEFGLPTPKGMLVLGIPGTGKSLVAKATASILGVPLLKLDAGRIFGSLVGESESNIRQVIDIAEAVSPCVLWIDELEKGFSGSASSGKTDGGTTSRVFGTFLQWMQEKTKPVFVVATANDVSQLPPEMLRKGRFDEQFAVDLPDRAERKEIWAIQIAKRNRKPKAFDLDRLAEITEQWTGAEIEAVVSEGLYAAFDAGKDITTDLLAGIIAETQPLSRMMAAQIDALRAWAEGRARRASGPIQTAVKTVSRKLVKAK